MVLSVKNGIKYVLNQFNLYGPYVLRNSEALKNDGWFRSFAEKACVDGDGKPVPWLTYPAIDFLKKRLPADVSIFEYGSGWSSLWWASRARAVTSVEHERAWYEKMKPLMPGNSVIHYIPLEVGGAYSKKVAEYEAAFDVIVIDGRDRVNCALNAVSALKSAGVIIWDNSDRPRYEPGFKHLMSNGFHKIEFIGLAPLLSFKSETSIFYRTQNCLRI